MLKTTDGSATFNGSITGTFNVWSSTQSVTFANGAAGTSKGLRVGTVSAPENAYIQADGNASFVSTRAAGFIIETERDNDAYYTTTTDSEGNQTRVYNGPTLDVKAVIQDLQQRVNDRDAVITNLTTRIQTLEANTTPAPTPAPTPQPTSTPAPTNLIPDEWSHIEKLKALKELISEMNL